ncbi:hypothetical protein ACIQAC_10740 [Streptomyces sp. NPDC088387]|uniref:hypothetical protein n=1 Tax=Streptomyces sp. NPDC088387 TaxID=3365859 RepID=UPI003817D344
MENSPRNAASPQPPGTPRWVAMFYEPTAAEWRVGAESPYRAPVAYAIGEMAQTLRARGDELAVSLWGPEDGRWRRHDAPTAADAGTGTGVGVSPSSEGPRAPAKLAERMTDRRQQVLLAGLSKAGVYDLAADDDTAVRNIVDRLDETTVRRLAHWLAIAGGR